MASRWLDRFAVVMLVAFASAPAGAQDESAEDRLATARAVVEASGQSATTQQLIDAVVQGVLRQDPGLQEALQEVVPPLTPRFDFYVKALLDDVARLYTARFSEEELQTLLAFLKTPAGEKFATAFPSINEESLQIGQKWGVRFGEDFRDAVRKELVARGVSLGSPAAAVGSAVVAPLDATPQTAAPLVSGAQDLEQPAPVLQGQVTAPSPEPAEEQAAEPASPAPSPQRLAPERSDPQRRIPGAVSR